jgi:hypothetical protein
MSTAGSLRVEAELTKLQSLAGGGTVKFRQLKAYINNVSVLCYRCAVRCVGGDTHASKPLLVLSATSW